MEIVYETDQVVAVLKEPGWSSQDGGGKSLPEELRKALGGEIYPIHRLGLNKLPGEAQGLDGSTLDGQMLAGSWLNHAGNDGSHLAARDGGIRGEGTGTVVPGQNASTIEQENVLIIRCVAIHVRKGGNRVDGVQLSLWQSGRKDVGQLGPGGRGGVVRELGFS